jgi:hypothetical protein
MPAERQMRMTDDDAALRGADAPLHATKVECLARFAFVLLRNYNAVVYRNALYPACDQAVDGSQHDARIEVHQPHPGV